MMITDVELTTHKYLSDKAQQTGIVIVQDQVQCEAQSTRISDFSATLKVHFLRNVLVNLVFFSSQMRYIQKGKIPIFLYSLDITGSH